MSSRNSSQRNMSHLTKMTNITASFYDLSFKSFWWGHENNYRRQVIELMDLNGNESVLDVGCGTGTLTLMIAKKMNGKGSILAVDLAPRIIEIAKKKARKQGNHVEYRVASSLALPFDNGTFDVVVTSLLYHQLMSREEQVKTVSEIWRVLRVKVEGTATPEQVDEFRAMWEEVRDAFLAQPDWELFEGISKPFPVGGQFFWAFW